MHIISTTRRGRVIAAITTGAFMLSACGQGSEALPSDKNVACDKADVIEALSEPMTDATSVKYEYAYDPEGGSVAPKVVIVERGRDSTWSVSYEGVDASRNGYFTNVVKVKSGVYVRIEEGTVEGVDDDEWVLFADASVPGADVSLETLSDKFASIIDDALIGSESVADGVYQLGESTNFKEYQVTSSARVEGACEYKLSQVSTSTDYMNSDPITAQFDDEGHILGLKANEGTTLTFGYDALVVETPQKLSDVEFDDVAYALSILATEERLETVATTFDRQLRADASNNAYDSNPRKASLLMGMLERGDAPAGLSVTVKGRDGASVMAWDGEKLTATLAKLDPNMMKVGISDGTNAVCIMVSEALNEPSVITGGECAW
jgi:hypothetical protein